MNTETAYELIALHAAAEAGNTHWDTLVSEVIINRRSANVRTYAQVGDARQATTTHAPTLLLTRAHNAILFLRDTWCEATGEVVWGFTFTYFSDDSFTIDYLYERPDWIAPLAVGENLQGDFTA